MGNVLIEGPRKGDPTQQYQRWLQQNPDLLGKQILTQNKLFRTSSYKFKNRNIILKVFFKRDQSPLTQYIKIFQSFNNTLENYKIINIISLKLFSQKDNRPFVVAYRQKMAQTVQDIITGKPMPTQPQKKWIIFQMIKAVYVIHKNFNFYHGHIRTSNFIVTTYGYLMLTDFAFYKPLYMLYGHEQGWSQSGLFYGSSVQNCTLAPQKLVKQFKSRQKMFTKQYVNYQLNSTQNSNSNLTLQSSNQMYQNGLTSSFVQQDNLLTSSFVSTKSDYSQPTIMKPRSAQQLNQNKQQLVYSGQISSLQKMDIFSLGCSILQVLRDGKPLLTYESYLLFRKGQFLLDPIIDQACKDLQNGQKINILLKSMLALDPLDRPNIQQIQRDFSNIININIYTLIWYCTSAFTTSSFILPDFRIGLIYEVYKFIQLQQKGLVSDFKIRLPRFFQFLSPLKIFRSIIKNKIIYVDYIPENCILRKIIDSNQKQQYVVQQQQQIIKEETDARRQFFFSKKNSMSIRGATASIQKFQKILCPPEWNIDLIRLIQPKITKCQAADHFKNRFQDLLKYYKKNQQIRQMRIQQKSQFYKQYNMVVKIVFSCIRSCKYNASKLIGIQLLKSIARQSTDQICLTQMIPLFISLLYDQDIVTAKYVFNSIIDLFYMFIDPFHNQQQTYYYQKIILMFVNCINTPKFRTLIFQRLPQIYAICQWLEVHIKKILKDNFINKIKNNLQTFIDVIKNNFCSYKPHQVMELMMNIPDIMWPCLFQYFISFLNSEKILGLSKGTTINFDNQVDKKIIDAIDSCMESGLDENGISLYYTIKYFTNRKVFNQNIVKKIAAMVIHPHLWVREQAKDFIEVVLEQNPPTRTFFLLREVFQPPFPLQPKNIVDDTLLPYPLLQSEVDFVKKKIKDGKKLGLPENIFIQYLSKIKPTKNFPLTKQTQIQEWITLVKNFTQKKIQPTYFNNYIKKSIYQLFQSNFLYYVGNAKAMYKQNSKQQEKKKSYEELSELLKRLNILSLEENQIGFEKKQFFISLATIVNSNFEKLLTRFLKQDKNNKIRVSQSIIMILETLHKFDQFSIKQKFKLCQYQSKQSQSLQKYFRPKGQLITQIYQHKQTISCLENINDKFLISASQDGTVRIFNTQKIQCNTTCQSEGMYQINSDHPEDKIRINSLAVFENTYAVAVASNKGNIRIFQLQRMKGSKTADASRKNKAQNTHCKQLLKYGVGGEIQKILTFKNSNKNQCYAFITGEGTLGVQDIRMGSKTMKCNLGKERGITKALAFSTMGPALLIGTLDGYVLTYDIRCNLISHIRQLKYDGNPVSVTGIYQSPHQVQGRPIFAFTYPSKFYQFSYFDIYNDTTQFFAQKHYTSCDRLEVITVPTMINKTKQQNFKICNNTLTRKLYYKQLTDFNKNFKILNYLSDPFTIKQAKIREVWMDRCKHRYNQICSIYNKKSLPFVEHLQHGVMINMNPFPAERKQNGVFSVLVDKMDAKQSYEIEKVVSCKPPGCKIYSFAEEENADYLTCCKIIGNMVFVGGLEPVIKVYK